jgi:hypothetical protein
VSYGVRFESGALVQLNGLPGTAFDALLERVADLVDEPWDATVMPPGSDPAYRVTVFGAGNGLLSFHVDGAAQMVRIIDIAWIGWHARRPAVEVSPLTSSTRDSSTWIHE